jgi:hypothetical protein
LWFLSGISHRRTARTGLHLAKPTLTHVAENLFWGENGVIFEISLLPDLAIHPRGDLRRWNVMELLGTDQYGANRGKLVEGFGKEELARRVLGELKQPARQVVPNGITQNVVFGFFDCHITAVF